MTTSSVPSVSDSGPTLRSEAWQDLISGLLRHELWGRLGWLDVKRRYRRTALGPFWTSISLGLYTLAVGLVGSGLWQQDVHAYLPFLISGLVVWYLVSAMIQESCSLFVAGYALFRNIRFEYSILVYQLLWRNFIVFLHNFIVYLLIVVLLKPSLLSPINLLAIPGLAATMMIGGWMAMLCGMLCLRFRDVQSLVTTAIQISMLITPIFWPPDSLSGLHRVAFVEFNPLYHMVDVVRAPLLGKLPSLTSYAVVLSLAIGGWIVAYFVFSRFRNRIAYWS